MATVNAETTATIKPKDGATTLLVVPKVTEGGIWRRTTQGVQVVDGLKEGQALVISGEGPSNPVTESPAVDVGEDAPVSVPGYAWTVRVDQGASDSDSNRVKVRAFVSLTNDPF